MNLFELVNAHHKPLTSLVTVELMNEYLRLAAPGNIRMAYVELDISVTQAAVLLAYAGNINHCLPDREYIQFNEIVKTAVQGLRQGMKPEPMTTTLYQHVRKVAGY